MINKQLDIPNIDIELDKILHELIMQILEDNYQTVNVVTTSKLEAKSELKQLINSIVLEARIDERLYIREKLNNIHYKYLNDDANSDRLFRNDFMSVFSEYLKETVAMVDLLKQDRIKELGDNNE